MDSLLKINDEVQRYGKEGSYDTFQNEGGFDEGGIYR